MNNITNFHSKEGVEKLKDLLNEITICLFCINTKTGNEATAGPWQHKMWMKMETFV